MSVYGMAAPVQVAYAVTDIDSAASEWRQRAGAGPFFAKRHIPLTSVRYRGERAHFDHSSAYGQWGPIMVELMQDHTSGASPVRDVIGDRGQGLHHFAFFIDDLEQQCHRLAQWGWPEALYAETSNGQAFALVDATRDLGHMIELYEPTPSLRSFYAMVAAAARVWDGSDPVREL